MNVWILGCAAYFKALLAASISNFEALLNPHIFEFLITLDISVTASKSPLDAAGNPASIMSTPRASNAVAIFNFSSIFIEAPGDCSPSRNVVSKIFIWFVFVILNSYL